MAQRTSSRSPSAVVTGRSWYLICETVSDACRYIGHWLREQKAVGEESITDWLLWHLSRELSFVRYIKLTKRREAKEGADWEWWFIGSKLSFGMRVQAKRLRLGEDHYPDLARSNRYGLQIEKLIARADGERLLAFYCLYHPEEASLLSNCPAFFRDPDSGSVGASFRPRTTVLMAGACRLQERFFKTGRKTVYPDDLVVESLPLACWFCCPRAATGGDPVQGLLAQLRSQDLLGGSSGEGPRLFHWEELPHEVTELLARGEGKDHDTPPTTEELFERPPKDVDALVVFDLRGEWDFTEGEPCERPGPCARIDNEHLSPDARVRALAQQSRALGLWALATAWGVADATVVEIVGLGGSWGSRARIYQALAEEIGDPRRALALLDRLRRRTRNGNDLFFLDLAVRRIGEQWPEHAKAAQRLREHFFDHIPPPTDEGLFRWIETPKDGRVRLWCEVPAGKFWMGRPEGEEGYDDELPRHRLTFAKGYRIAAVPVTNAQYAAFDPDHKWHRWEGVKLAELTHHPVVGATWYEAVSFVRWQSATFPELRGARLPTEEEWEYACRAGTETACWKGNTETDLADVGWYAGNSGSYTHRVGEKPANAWGLYDVLGNVWEWTLSPWEESYKSRVGDPPHDPISIAVDAAIGDAPGGVWRVIRGGSSWVDADDARSAFRVWDGPSNRSYDQGFRVVVPVAPRHWQ